MYKKSEAPCSVNKLTGMTIFQKWLAENQHELSLNNGM